MTLHRHRHHVGHRSPDFVRRVARDRVRLGADFGKLWSAGAVSNLADGMTGAALPLLAAAITRDPLTVAAIAALHSLPWIVFELVAGEIVDRVDRRRLMMFGNVVRAAAISLIAVLVASDGIALWSLGALAFAIGMAETLVDTSWEAVVPRLVATKDLTAANGRSQAVEWTADELIGPPLGALLFAAAAALPFFVNGGAFILAAILVASIPGTFKAEREVQHGLQAIRHEIGEGVRWLWHHRVLRALSLMAGTANLMGTATFAVFVLFAQDILRIGDVGFGLIISGLGIGGITGAALSHRVEARLGTGTLLLSSMVGVGAASLVIASTSSAIVVGVAFALDGLMIAMWNVSVISLRQSLIPDELRGRVASVARTIAFGAIPIGAVLGGVLADLVGLRAPYFLSAIVYAVALVLVSRVISNAKIETLRAEVAAGE